MLCIIALFLVAGEPIDVDAATRAVLPKVVEWRRDIHQHPELGEREVRTAALVADHLESLGLEVRREIAVTGVVGILRGEKPGPVVAWRADMDALPILERTELPFASKVQDRWGGMPVGVMHACGHDMHTAIALGVATVLADPAVRSELRGTVMFVFQPAEEGHPDPGSHGAKRMLEEGLFDELRPGAIFGLHTHPGLRVGEVAAIPGGTMAAVDRFRIGIRGKQAHGAKPQEGIDPIVVASHVVLALQTIASRTVDPLDSVVVTVGSIEAGNRFNIIPGEARLVGTIRTHEGDVQDRVHESVRRIATDVSTAFGATAEIEIEKISPVTFNDPELCERMLPSLSAVAELGFDRPHMGGEDFAYFAQEVPGLYFFLGVTPPGVENPSGLHTPLYAPDEGALEVGVRAATRVLLDWLAG